MEENEMLEQTNETENVDTQTTEENGEGIDLTDTAETTESDVVDNATSSDETVDEKKEEVKHTLKELLESNPEYQVELNSMMKGRLDRQERKFQKELSKYRDTDNVLRTVMNLNDGDDPNEKLREYYEKEGVKLPEKVKSGLTEHQLEVLAQAEAKEIIESGDSAYIKAEANKLASKGWENMNQQERAIFNTLAGHLDHEKKINELKSIGVQADLLDSTEFKDFAGKFNSNTSIKDIYELYSKSHKEPKTAEKIGSMKSTAVKDNGVKEFYSYEEALKFTKEDFDKNPALYKAVERSMYKW